MLDQFYSLGFRFPAGALVFAAMLAGCASSGRVSEAEHATSETSEKRLPLSAYEATLDPSEYDQDVEIAEKPGVEEKNTRVSVDAGRDTTVLQEDVVQGYRIQVFSSSNVDEANHIKAAVLEKVPADSVYVVYDPPVYKVRVGDFPRRYDADQRLPDFVAIGYRDAWIVPDRVVVRRYVRVPLPQ